MNFTEHLFIFIFLLFFIKFIHKNGDSRSSSFTLAFTLSNGIVLFLFLLKKFYWSSHRVTVEMNLTRSHEVADSIPDLA